MEVISWGLDEKIRNLGMERGKQHVIKEEDTLRTVGALITKEADWMSALRFPMTKADQATWMDMKVSKKNVERRKH